MTEPKHPHAHAVHAHLEELRGARDLLPFGSALRNAYNDACDRLAVLASHLQHGTVDFEPVEIPTEIPVGYVFVRRDGAAGRIMTGEPSRSDEAIALQLDLRVERVYRRNGADGDGLLADGFIQGMHAAAEIAERLIDPAQAAETIRRDAKDLAAERVALADALGAPSGAAEAVARIESPLLQMGLARYGAALRAVGTPKAPVPLAGLLECDRCCENAVAPERICPNCSAGSVAYSAAMAPVRSEEEGRRGA